MSTNDQGHEALFPDDNEELEGLTGKELDEEEEAETRGEDGDAVAGYGRFQRVFRGLKGRTGIRVGIALMLFLGLGVGMIQGQRWFPRSGDSPATLSEAAGVDQDHYEEKLSPLFVPVPEGGACEAVMIRFSVIWDGLASFRYGNMELQIRNRLYQYVTGLLEEKKDLKGMIDSLEAEMRAIFRESLRLEDLAVKIKEVREI
ncbi:MAG: hypothetical protein ACOWYE_16380 [Desulfatiglandales bacterium]